LPWRATTGAAKPAAAALDKPHIPCYTHNMTKAEIRRQIKEILASPAVNATLHSQSRTICQNILHSQRYVSCTTLLAYMPLPDEVNISPVISEALRAGKKVYLPRIIPDTNLMEFYRCTSTDETQSGSFGIKEPAENQSQSFSKVIEDMSINEYAPAPHSSTLVELKEEFPAKEHILVLVPGRAFTKDGKRIGRGKGCYDLYLSKIPLIFDIKKAGVCFSQQLLADLPTTPDDVIMDYIFSAADN